MRGIGYEPEEARILADHVIERAQAHGFALVGVNNIWMSGRSAGGRAARRDPALRRAQGLRAGAWYLFISFKPDLFVPLEDYRRALAAEIALIKATPRQEGADEIRIPGERARLARDGLEIDRRIHDALIALAEGNRDA